ncbi:MAG TPA: hypothetical protein VHE53_01655 [Patescibacteria group bacterium]|nr:hypothetical protein [Patescibacteria group bacterium]
MSVDTEPRRGKIINAERRQRWNDFIAEVGQEAEKSNWFVITGDFVERVFDLRGKPLTDSEKARLSTYRREVPSQRFRGDTNTVKALS